MKTEEYVIHAEDFRPDPTWFMSEEQIRKSMREYWNNKNLITPKGPFRTPYYEKQYIQIHDPEIVKEEEWVVICQI